MFNNGYRICTAFGIPIKVHVSLLILLPLAAYYLMPRGEDFRTAITLHPYIFTILTLAGLFASVALHELGHSLVGIACGYKIREIILLPIGGIARVDHISGKSRDEILVSIAGPATSIALSLIFFLCARIMSSVGILSAAVFFDVLAVINLLLALFNLLPAFPMDGGRILRAWISTRLGKLEATRRAVKIGQSLFLILGFIGLWYFNPILIIIAFVLYRAAAAELRMTIIQEQARRQPFTFSDWGITSADDQQEAEIHVSPPPYADIDRPEWIQKIRKWLNKE